MPEIKRDPRRDPKAGDIWKDGILWIKVTESTNELVRYILFSRFANLSIIAPPTSCSTSRHVWKKNSKRWDLIHTAKPGCENAD